MGYFTEADLAAVSQASDDETCRQKFHDLHQHLYRHIIEHEFDLHLVVPESQAIDMASVSDLDMPDALTVGYLRKRSQAVLVERLMGREVVASVNNIMVRLHPVLELRLWQAGIAFELVIAPDAWWDQQNLKGKLSIARHKFELYNMLAQLDDSYCMGFWQGVHQSDMKLNADIFQHPRILDEWLSTFSPTNDWFRVGIWYDAEDTRMAADTIHTELAQQLEKLHAIYQFILWTSDNNFREFHSS